LARNLATPCLGREPKAKVATFAIKLVVDGKSLDENKQIEKLTHPHIP
jgi:hypothetical protein